MILTNCLAQSQPPTFKNPVVMESMLERATSVTQFPWLLPAMLRLRELEKTGAVVPGIGDLRISEQTADTVRRLLSRISVRDLPLPRVSPISGGGIALSWQTPRRGVDFTIYPNEVEFGFVSSTQDDEVLSEGTITINEARRINQLLNQLVAE